MTSRILCLNGSLGRRIIFSKPNPCLINCKCLEGVWTGVFRTAVTANPRGEWLSTEPYTETEEVNEKNLQARSGHQIELGSDLQVSLTSLPGHVNRVRISKIISNSISLCIGSKRIKQANLIFPNQYFLSLYIIVALKKSQFQAGYEVDPSPVISTEEHRGRVIKTWIVGWAWLVLNPGVIPYQLGSLGHDIYAFRTQFPNLSSGQNDSPYLVGLLWGLNLSTHLSLHHACPGLYGVWEQLRSLQFSVGDKLMVRSQRTSQYTLNKRWDREETFKQTVKPEAPLGKLMLEQNVVRENTGLRAAEKRVVSTQWENECILNVMSKAIQTWYCSRAPISQHVPPQSQTPVTARTLPRSTPDHAFALSDYLELVRNQRVTVNEQHHEGRLHPSSCPISYHTPQT